MYSIFFFYCIFATTAEVYLIHHYLLYFSVCLSVFQYQLLQ